MGELMKLIRPVGGRLIRFGKLIDVLVVSLMATAMLLICSRIIDASRIHVSGLDGTLNDQVGYIAMGREYADTGRLDNQLVLPSTLWQRTSKNYQYMPAHYLALAASYKLLGFGVLQSLLPNLISFVLATVGVFLSGAKIYGRRVGFIASFFFIIFPANVIYAFTAMSEMTRVAATILAFAVFVYLSDRWRLILGPFLPVVPFLFRETGALLIIPFGLVVVATKGAKSLAKTFMFLLATSLVLFFSYQSDLSAGRLNFVNAFVFDPRFETIYTDAVAQQAVASKTITDWIARLPPKVLSDGSNIIDQIVVDQPGGVHFEVFSFTVPLVIMIAAAAIGFFNRDKFLIGASLLEGAALLMLLTLFIPVLSGYVRWLLFTFAFGAIVGASLYDRYVLSKRLPQITTSWRVIQLGLPALLLGASLYGIYRTAYRVSASDALDDGFTACVDKLGQMDNRMVVLPYYMGDYVYHHYPIRASLLPANAPTLSLLRASYDVGTVIALTEDGKSLDDTQITITDLAQSGLRLTQDTRCSGREYMVFKDATE